MDHFDLFCEVEAALAAHATADLLSEMEAALAAHEMEAAHALAAHAQTVPQRSRHRAAPDSGRAPRAQRSDAGRPRGPRSASASATGDTAGPLAMEEALAILLQHPSVSSDQQLLVCQLLCVSKGLRAAIAAHLQGQVAIDCNLDPLTIEPPMECYEYKLRKPKADGFAAWTAQHAGLMQSLNLYPPVLCLKTEEPQTAGSRSHSRTCEEPAAAIAAALQQAAAAAPNGTLRLQSYSTHDSNAAILQQIASSSAAHLTAMELRFGDSLELKQHSSISISAISRLTRLRSLSLEQYEAPLGTLDAPIDVLLPALRSLVQLTKLKLEGVADAGSLQHLPPQLRELQLGYHHGVAFSQRRLQLSHLTALTKLEHWFTYFTVSEGDVLPPRLKQLQVNDCSCMQPLLDLKQLEVLRVDNCTMSAQQLQQLSSLSQLSRLVLHHPSTAAAMAAAAAWGKLPVQTLELKLHNWRGEVTAAAAADLAAALRAATSLERVGLEARDQVDAFGEEELHAAPERLAVLTRAIAGLPQLTSLILSGAVVNGTAGLPLAAARQLTALSVWYGAVEDSALAVMLPGLTGLQRLFVNSTRVTDACVPVIVQLKQLTEIRLGGSRITEEGIDCLQCSLPALLITE